MKGKEKIDVIVYRKKGFKEPWFLLVPANSEDLLPTELVVEWYRANLIKVLADCLRSLTQNLSVPCPSG